MSNKIVDITTYQSINNTRKYFIDTNALYWYTYPRFSNNLSAQALPYYNFIDSLVAANNPLITSIYNISELLNVIEKNEFDIYTHIHPDAQHVSRKDFRRMPSERSNLQKMMKTTLENVYAICDVVEFPFDSIHMYQFIETLTSHRCDVFDYMIIQNNIKEENTNIITDDGDFSTIPDITIYTANIHPLPDIN